MKFNAFGKEGNVRLKPILMTTLIYAVLLPVVIYPIGRLLLSSFWVDTIGDTTVWTLKNFTTAFAMRGVIEAGQEHPHSCLRGGPPIHIAWHPYRLDHCPDRYAVQKNPRAA